MKKINEYATLSKKWWSEQDEEVIKFVNGLIDKFACRMFEVRNGSIYMVIEHYKYLDFKRNAKRVKLAKAKGGLQDGYYYLTHKI